MARQRTFSINAETVAWKVVDGFTVLIDLVNGGIYELNPSATFIWQSLQSQSSMAQIQARLQSRYPYADPRVIEQDLSDFIEFISRKRFVCSQGAE